MGNQSIKTQLSNVTEQSFDDSLLDKWIEKLQSFDTGGEFTMSSLPYELLSGDRDSAKAFPMSFKVDAITDSGQTAIANATSAAGFTSGEKKIADLQSENAKTLAIYQNEGSLELEEAIKLKMAIITAMVMNRNKGSETQDDLLTYAQKEGESMEGKTSFQAAFNALTLVTPESLGFMLEKQPNFVKQVLGGLLEQSRGIPLGASMNESKHQQPVQDVQQKFLKDLLLQVTKSSHADKGLKTIVVRLLLRLGYIFASADECLLAAELQDELGLDISWELQPILSKNEKFRQFQPPQTGSSGGLMENKDCTTIQSRVSFNGQDDRTQDDDNAIHDGKYYYMWSSQRGLFKGLIKDDNEWAESEGCVDVKSEYKKLTFVYIDGKVHLRSGHLPDEPFVELDPETCKVKEGYEPFTSTDDLLKWTSDTEDSTIGDSEKGFRYLRATQMHYRDDELWVMAVYKESSWTSSVKQYVIEVYEREGRNFKRTQEIPLFKEDGTTPFKGAKRRGTEYTDRGMLHKNREYIVWSSGKTWHAFNRETGQRMAKRHETGTQHVVFYLRRLQKFAWMDCACYSYLQRVEKHQYDPEDQSTKADSKNIEMPILCDDMKQTIKTQLEEANLEEVKAAEGEEPVKKQKERKRPQLNHFSMMLGIQSGAAAEPSEDVPTLPANNEIHKFTKAIIYSFINCEANYSMQAAKHSVNKKPIGEKMVPFCHAKFGVHFERDFIERTIERTANALKVFQQGSATEFQMVELQTHLHLLYGTLMSIKCCRLSANQILTDADLDKIIELSELMLKVKANQGTKDKNAESMTNIEKLQIKLEQLAQQASQQIQVQLDRESGSEKLQKLQKKLNSFNPEDAYQMIVKLSDEDELQKLFADPSSFGDLQLVFDGCCFTVNQRLKTILQQAITQKVFRSDLDSDFAQSAAKLQSMLSKELCATYGDQLYIILDKKAKATGKKPEDMKDTEWSKLVNKYEGAVKSHKELDKILFDTFINVCEHLNFQMNTLTSQLQKLDPASFTKEDIGNLMTSLQAYFSRETSILRTVMLFSLTFSAIEVDVTWLDEISEGLKLAMTAINDAILSLKRLYITETEDLKMSENDFTIYLQNSMRQLSYTLGHVAGRLIQVGNQDKDGSDTLSRLNILSGGLENRFIPGLSEATKTQIEGSFKITGDKQLQSLSLSASESIQLNDEDTVLQAIINNEDSVRPTLEMLQQALMTKQPMCVFARLGGNDGANITRAAFAVIIKFSQSIDDFQTLISLVKQNGGDAKTVVASLKEQKNAQFEILLKRWEISSHMRKWTQQIKQITSGRTLKEEETAFREAWNAAHPSEDPLTGKLSDEQQQEVEKKADDKFWEELKKEYAEVVSKAQMLLKLQLPQGQLVKRKTLKKQGQLSFKLDKEEVVTEEEKDYHIVIQRQETSKMEKDKEFDWRERLNDWWKIAKSKGAIVDLGAKTQLNSNSISLATLGLLQSEFTSEQINDTIERALIQGLRRSAGINLVRFGMELNGDERIFQDMLQWFSASLRNRKNSTIHFLDGLSGCGTSCENGIRTQFFKILEYILLKLKISEVNCDNDSDVKLLLINLCWNYKAEDHEQLVDLNLFEFLSMGDGTGKSWVNYYQGRYKTHYCDNDVSLKNLNLARTLQHVIEYLQNQVLSSILETDKAAQVIESARSQSSMLHRTASLNKSAAVKLFEQMTRASWNTLERSLKVNRMGPTYEFQNNSKHVLNRMPTKNMVQSTETHCAPDSYLFLDLIEKNPKVKTLREFGVKSVEQKKNEEAKLNSLIKRIDQEERDVSFDPKLQDFLVEKIGPVLSSRCTLPMIIEKVKARDLRVQAILRTLAKSEFSKDPSKDADNEAEVDDASEDDSDVYEWKAEITPYKHNKLVDKKTFRRQNAEAEKQEVMAYAADNEFINADAPEEFERVEREDAVWKLEGFKNVFQMKKINSIRPIAQAEMVPNAWAEIDIALYHGFEKKPDRNEYSLNIKVCIASSQNRYSWETVYDGPTEKDMNIDDEKSGKMIRQVVQTVKVPADILNREDDYEVYVELKNDTETLLDEWFIQGIGITCVTEREITESQKLAGQLVKVATYKSEDDKIHSSDNNRTHYFGYTAQSRVVMQLEQVIGIAEKSKIIYSLLEESLHPKKMQQLMELAAQSHPIVQQLVQRIFQTILRIGLPQNIYDMAIEASVMEDQRGLPTRLAQLLKMDGVIQFPESKFLQLLVNSIQLTFEKLAHRDNIVTHHSMATTHETARTLRVLQALPEKNAQLAALFKQRLAEAFCTIDQLNDSKAETLCFLVTEMKVQTNTFAGQAVELESGDKYIILSNKYESSSHDYQVLLYCDSEKADRQQIIDTAEDGQAREKANQLLLKPVMEISHDVTVTAAQNSILNDPNVVKFMINMAANSEKEGVSKLSSLAMRSVICSFNRGLKHMIETLKSDYIDMLGKNNLLDPILNYFVMVSGQSTIPFDEQLRCVEIKEMQVDQIRQSLAVKNTTQELTKLFVNWEQNQFIIQNVTMKYDCSDSTVKAFKKHDFAKIKSCVTTVANTIKDNSEDQVETGEIFTTRPDFYTGFDARSGSCWHTGNESLFLRSADLMACSFSTVDLFSTAKVIITDDEEPIDQILKSIIESFKKHKSLKHTLRNTNQWPMNVCFIQLGQNDFQRIYDWVSCSLLAVQGQDEEKLDFRAKVLNQLAYRISASKSDDEDSYFSCDVPKIISKLTKMSVEEQLPAEGVIATILEECEDLDEEIKKHLTSMKDGDVFEPPVSEEKVNEINNLLAGGINNMFKKPGVDEPPNFGQMFYEQEEAVRDNIKSLWLDPCHDSQRYGENSDSRRRETTVQTELTRTEVYNSAPELKKLKDAFIAYKVLNEAICRDTLITILGQMADKVSDQSRQLLNNDELKTRLDDLIHNSHMIAMHQSKSFIEQVRGSESAQRASAVIKFLAQSDIIRTFLINDLFKRAKETLKLAMQDDFLKFTERDVKLKNFREVIKLEAILDPYNLILLSKNFTESEHLEEENLPQLLVAFIDLCLIYAIMFISDKKSLVSLELLDQTQSLLQMVQAHINLFANKAETLSRITESVLIKWLVEMISDDELKSNIKEKNQILAIIQVAETINNMKDMARQKLDLNLKVGFEPCEKVQKLLEQVSKLREGTEFTSESEMLKFNILLTANDPQIEDFGHYYDTFQRRFKNPIQMTFPAKDEDWRVKVAIHNSDQYLQMSSEDGTELFMDKSGFESAQGMKEIVAKAGNKVTITYPVKPQAAQWFGCLKTYNSDLREKFTQQSGITIMLETIEFNVKKVMAATDHVTFIASDGRIFGMGRHAGENSATGEALQEMPLPDGVSVEDLAFVGVGRWSRNLLTNDGKFYFRGKSRYYNFSNTNTSHSQSGFEERFQDNFLRVEDGDKIVDWVSGLAYNTFLTEKGKIINQGYCFWRVFDSSIRNNTENYEDHPFTLSFPEGFTKAVKLFPCMRTNKIYVNFEKSDKTIKSYVIGSLNEAGTDGQWNALNVPNEGHFKKIITPYSTESWGIDNKQRLYLWADVSQFVKEEHHPCFEGNDFSQPRHVKWFTDKKIKVLDIEGGRNFCIALTENAQGKREFYALGLKTREKQCGDQARNVDRFGPDAKDVAHQFIYLLSVNASQIASFACTFDASYFVMKSDNKIPVSIIPDKPEAKGMIHFYKKDDEWKFVSQDEYEEKKGELPKLCFATHQSISDFKNRPWADLDSLAAQVDVSDGEPYYFTKYVQGLPDSESEKERFSMCPEGQFLENSMKEINPLIYVRTSGPSNSCLNVLPTFKLTDYFELEESNNSDIAISHFKKQINQMDTKDMQLNDPAQQTLLRELKNFTNAEDCQLVAELDNIAKEKNVKIVNLDGDTVQPASFCMSVESPIFKKGEKIIKMRCKLLLGLIKSYVSVLDVFNSRNKNVQGSIGSIIHSLRFILPVSISNQLLDNAINELNDGSTTTIYISRRRAMDFADQGKIDHEGKYSMYGQIVQQLISKYPDMQNFRQKSVDQKCYEINFKGEGSIDAGGPFRESLTNIANELESGVVPILIRSPNNRNEHGINRDCFILDSSSKTPAHMTLFRYFGGFLAYAFLTKSPMPLNIAPWVWKQLIEQEVTLNDLDGIDTYSAQVLRDLEQHGSTLSVEDFEAGVDQNFMTVLSSGQEVPICPDGETKRVTKENLSEFIEKVIEARRNEAKVQVDAIREGFLKVLENKHSIIDLMTWEAFEMRCTGEKHISMERLKTITTFPNNAQDHQIVGRFWRVFEAWSDVERSAYLKFVWGRSRLPIDLSRLNRKHEVRLFTNMDKTAFPQSHTCFFQLDIPDYETDEMCNNRLSAAAQLCGEIDTDNAAAEDLD